MKHTCSVLMFWHIHTHQAAPLQLTGFLHAWLHLDSNYINRFFSIAFRRFNLINFISLHRERVGAELPCKAAQVMPFPTYSAFFLRGETRRYFFSYTVFNLSLSFIFLVISGSVPLLFLVLFYKNSFYTSKAPASSP